jgi:hypothetical protein
MIEQELGYPSAIANLIQCYIDNIDLAWIGVAAIRAIEGTSHENKYASINWGLLNSIYPGWFDTHQQRNESLVTNRGREEKECNCTSNSSVVGYNNTGSNSLQEGEISSQSSGPYTGGEGGTIGTVELPYKEATVMYHLSEPITYERKQALQPGNDNMDTSTTETLLKKFLIWSKDIPEELHQQILPSFSIQQILKFLKTTLNPDKFIKDQLSFEATQEKFEGGTSTI